MYEQQMREAFESWASDAGTWKKAVERNREGAYVLMMTQMYWTAWQAALVQQPDRNPITVAYSNPERHQPIYRQAFMGTQQPAAVPEGWKLVPIVPTPEMATAMRFAMGAHADECHVWSDALEAAPKPYETQPEIIHTPSGDLK